jgi:HD-GYP domain-containing protein (c-di-GMP phosphodiesterase class II)
MKSKDTKKIIAIGMILSSETNIDKLFSKILSTSREITNADAGSLYIKKENELDFIISQNDTLEKRFNVKSDRLFKPFTLSLTRENIAGYVCLTGEILNIEDVYKIDESAPYHFYRSFDKKYEYKTTSMLGLPLKDRENNVIGVLQLINAKDKGGNIVKFDEKEINLVNTLASFAAVSLKTALLTQNVKDAHLSTIYRLVSAAEYKDPDTGDHLERMSNYSKIIARYMGYDEEFQETMLYASPMHDIGKIGIPDKILDKPGKLTSEERKIMEKHSLIGADILKDPETDLLKMAQTIALTHHEKWNGTGYPNHLKGEEIPIEGRITALADVFDALSVKRVYKPAWPFEKVVALIKEESGEHFCSYVVDAFFKGIEEIKTIYLKYKE